MQFVDPGAFANGGRSQTREVSAIAQQEMLLRISEALAGGRGVRASRPLRERFRTITVRE